MLKFILDSLEGLEESQAALYKKGEDGKFHLQVDGLPEPEDVSGLKNKINELMDETKAEKQKRVELEGKLSEISDKKARESGDVEAIERSWTEKYANREKELQGQIDALTGNITEMTVDSTASALANELAVDKESAKVLLPHIRGRLASEQRDGKFVTVVKDGEGKPSALTVDELRNEIANDASFSRVVKASGASGGGANAGEKGGGAASGNMGGSKEERAAALKARHPELG